jgi:hypothetical protein
MRPPIMKAIPPNTLPLAEIGAGRQSVADATGEHLVVGHGQNLAATGTHAESDSIDGPWQ